MRRDSTNVDSVENVDGVKFLSWGSKFLESKIFHLLCEEVKKWPIATANAVLKHPAISGTGVLKAKQIDCFQFLIIRILS